jgi:hypothetical protein
MTVPVLDARIGCVILGRDGRPVLVVGRDIDLGIGGAGGPRLWLRLRDAAGVVSRVEYKVTSTVEWVASEVRAAVAEPGAAADGGA